MKCPHCGYEHGWSGEHMSDVTGKDGDFYRHPVDMVRREDYEGRSTMYLFGCPSCLKTFMDYT